jgi:mono/diheme cytochrome c family protein
MMKNILLAHLLLLSIVITGCAGTPQPTTVPASPTQTESQPTPSPVPTETAVPAADISIPPTEAPAVTASFANDILPILQTSCVECHGVRQVKEGLDLQTYESVMAGSFHGPVIVPGNAAESLLVELIAKGEMPNRGPKLTAEQLQIIVDWINAGAPNN